MATDRERAVQLRAAGLDYGLIATYLGVSQATVYRWLNPDYEERQRRVSLAWKDRNREANRARDLERGRRPENRGACANPCCENLRGLNAERNRPADSPPRVGKNGQTYSHGYCQECVKAIAAVRRSLGEGAWADGWSNTEFRVIAGMDSGAARARGWDLPYRYKNTKRQRAQ